VKLAGEYTFDGNREEVWRNLRDPEVLATALPGTKKMNKVSDTEYEAEMNVRVGPVVGVFTGRFLISNEAPPESYTLIIEGTGKAGFLKGMGDIQLLEQGAGQTLMKYEGEVQIGGKVASVGQRLLDMTSKSFIQKGLDTINHTIQERRGTK
jgi:carbon monoxide dehydrogenase subunit G